MTKTSTDRIAAKELVTEAEGFALPEGIPALFTFYLYITNDCNLACRHCWITPGFVNGKPSTGDCLDLDLLKLAVKEGKELGLSNAKLTGGEPVLHPRFIEIVDYLSAEKIRLTMETNGTMITADLANHLKNNTTMWFVSVSLDSPDARKHDRFRGVEGAFAKSIKGIDHLVKAGFQPQIIMSPYHDNLNEVEALTQFAVKIGAGSVKFNPVAPTGRGKIMQKQGEILGYDEIIELVRFVRGELQERTSIPLYISIPPALASITEILREGRAGGECRILNILGILGDGGMALCGIGRNVPELCFGKLGRDDLKNVWFSHPTLVRIRRELNGKFPGICGNCVHAKRCLTHCAALNYERTGKLLSPNYLCEEAEFRNEFPASRKCDFTYKG